MTPAASAVGAVAGISTIRGHPGQDIISEAEPVVGWAVRNMDESLSFRYLEPSMFAGLLPWLGFLGALQKTGRANEAACRRLQQYRVALGDAFNEYFEAHDAVSRGDLRENAMPTNDDVGSAVVGGVIGLFISPNLAGAGAGVGVSLAGTIIWREGKNFVREESAWSDAANKLSRTAVDIRRKMKMGWDEYRALAELDQTQNCGVMGGSW